MAKNTYSMDGESPLPAPMAQTLLDKLPVVAFAIDSQHVLLYVNDQFVQNSGVERSGLLGKNLWSLWCPEQFSELKELYERAIATSGTIYGEYSSKTQDKVYDIHVTALEDCLLVVCPDVTARYNREQLMLRQVAANQRMFRELAASNQTAQVDAYTDALTGLNNRRRASELSNMIFVAMSDRSHSLSVITLDIDHFKRFNDTHGHKEGDNVLARVGRTIKRFSKESETAARIGGEEFVLLCPGLGESVANRRANALLSEIRAIQGTAASVTASIGVATLAPTDENWESILERADQAMYAAKRRGRNQVVSWSPDLASEAA